ncbi:ead/Ea22-like family protein [Salmonella enterica subsp. enterica]|nr:ead/Ea22-like family protein [Salmonella enterica subsp. enterica]
MNIDKQALREVAEKALPAMQRLLMMPNDELFDEAVLNVDGDVDAANAFNLSFGPETALALLDELEAETRYREGAFIACNRWHDKFSEADDKLEAAERRIAEQSAIVATAEKLVRCKGRYHSELNYRALAKLFGVVTPDLPPLEHENVHYADAAEVEITALRQRIAELEAREVVLPPRAPENLASCLDGYGNWVIATTFRDTWNACLSEVVRMNAAGIGVKQQDSVDSDVGSRNQPGTVTAIYIGAGDFVKVKGQVFEVEETDFDDHDVTLWFVGGNALKCSAGCPVEVVSAPVAAGIKVKGE